jgi:hypothetical protein
MTAKTLKEFLRVHYIPVAYEKNILKRFVLTPKVVICENFELGKCDNQELRGNEFTKEPKIS